MKAPISTRYDAGYDEKGIHEQTLNNQPTKRQLGSLCMTGYYEQHRDKAMELVRSQLANGWQPNDILLYWRALDYDIFFERSVVEPAIKQWTDAANAKS